MIPTKHIKRHINEFALPGTPEADERILNDALDAFEQAGSTQAIPITPHLHNWVTKTVAAIVVISVLIPLGYGASRMIRRLILKPVEKAEVTSDFKLDRDLHVDLRIGTKQVPEMVLARSIRFFAEEGRLRGTLRARVYSWPTFTWRTRITLLDAAGRRLLSTVHVSDNGGVKRNGRGAWVRHTIHFSLGLWGSDLQTRAQRVSVAWEQVPDNTETTPHAWLESKVLPVVHGRITRPDGRPIASAVVQVREERKEGQTGIAAPDLYTDRQGYYCFDDIHWAYHVGVIAYMDAASGAGDVSQYKHLNRILHGTNKVSFVFDDVSKGTAVLKGRMLGLDGKAVTKFRVAIKNQVDWQNPSGEYLYQYSVKKQVSDSEGAFAVSGLPAGKYRVLLIPTIVENLGHVDDSAKRKYACELSEGQILDVTEATEINKAWYGRVLFEDGSPAVLDLPGIKTQIVDWGPNATSSFSVATVDEDGYFVASMPDEDMARLKAGQTWLTVTIAPDRFYHDVQKGERFPVEFLSSQREDAGVLRITRPTLYHGRILYHNGKPAVPPAAPWPWAKVTLRLRSTPATVRTGGVTERLASLDKQGCFSIILTDEEYEKIKTGDYSLEIMHPSYEWERSSSPIGNFPVDLLSRDGGDTSGYILPAEGRGSTHKHLSQCLESYDLLNTLGSLLQQWRGTHNGELPENATQLDAGASVEILARIADTIEYQPSNTAGPDTEQHIIAYDKALLEIVKGTHVLFSNGSIEFLPQRKLDAVDINR